MSVTLMGARRIRSMIRPRVPAIELGPTNLLLIVPLGLPRRRVPSGLDIAYFDSKSVATPSLRGKNASYQVYSAPDPRCRDRSCRLRSRQSLHRPSTRTRRRVHLTNFL